MCNELTTDGSISQAYDFDEQFGTGPRVVGLAGDELDAAEQEWDSVRMADDLASIEAARTLDEAEATIRLELREAHEWLLAQVPAGAEVHVRREYSCRNWRTSVSSGEAQHKVTVAASAFMGAACIAFAEGQTPMEAARAALADMASKSNAAKVA